MFGHLSDDVIAALAVHFGDALDREIVRLGRAGGKDNLLGGRADQLGNLARAVSTAASASQPNAWFRLAAFPNLTKKYGIIASRTRASIGVVAWLSM